MKSLWSVLHDARELSGKTKQEIISETKLSPEAVEAIENGVSDFFESPAYARGAILRYASAVGVSAEKAEALMNRDLNYKAQLQRHNSYTPRSYRFIPLAVIGGILVGIVLLVFQLWLYVRPPVLTVQAPSRIRVNEPFIIKGTTTPGALVYLNNQQVVPGPDGTFTETLYLRKGTQTMTIEVVGTNGRRSKQTVPVVVSE